VREYIIHYQTIDVEFLQETKVYAGTLQDAIDIFREKNPSGIIMSAEGPYDIR
jgi:hypothetical protein